MQKNASSKISSNYIENYDLQLGLNLRTDNRTDAIECTKKILQIQILRFLHSLGPFNTTKQKN